MPIKPKPAQAEQEQPYNPPGPGPLVFDKFNGINTSTTRPGVPDEQMAWCDGFFPLGPRLLRTLWGVGAALWSPPAGTITFFDFANIGVLPVMIAVTSLGGVWQVVTTTGVATRIAPDGTIQTPLRSNVGISQWGSQYVIIVANQTNGYFVWDGLVLYQAGSLAPTIVLTNVGSGYNAQPVITATGGLGSGATFIATITSSGQVSKVTMLNPGMGYLASDAPSLVFTGGNVAGSGGTLTAGLTPVTSGSGGSITATWVYQGSGNRYIPVLNIAAGGSGYSNLATASFTPFTVGVNGWDFASPAPTILIALTSGAITNVALQPNSANPNAYFLNNGSAVFPTIVIADPGYYTVNTVTITAAGSGYGPSVMVAASGGGTPQTQAIVTPVISGGSIVNTNIVNGGIYGSNTPPTLTVTDTKTNAAATISLMPYAIQGNAVETYSGHVWVANGAAITFSAPGSISDFATSDGGGNLTSVDSFLRVGYVELIQSNGFLYLIADSSVNYISGVQTSGTPPTTTFTNQNADPEVGTPYAATVDVFSRNIVFANAFGAHVSYGAAVTKISEMLDGVYNTVPNFGGINLSACKAIVFGRKVWVLLLPIMDPISGNQTTKLFIWDSKKWVSTVQDIGLTYIQHQEIASIITAWGTDGHAVYPLFAQPSGNFTKTVQSRLWDTPGGYQFQKSSTRVWALAQFLNGTNPSYEISIDNENGIPSAALWVNAAGLVVEWFNGTPQPVLWNLNSGGIAVYLGTPNAVVWTNAAGIVVEWENGSSQAVAWYITGTGTIAVLPPQAVGQQGVLTGMTVSTQSADMILISAMLEDEIVGYRG